MTEEQQRTNREFRAALGSRLASMPALREFVLSRIRAGIANTFGNIGEYVDHGDDA